MAVVRLVHGDLFGGSADMITVPCSTAGTVTPGVERQLQQFSLPHPKQLTLGQVDVLPLDDAQHVAQYVAYAASVAAYTSEPAAISSIGEQLGQASCDLDAIGSISAPLLGAGAGGLPPDVVVRCLREGFEKTASADAVLSIFVLDADVYARLAEPLEREAEAAEYSWTRGTLDRGATRGVIRGQATTASAPTPPRVFISHSSLSPERMAWLMELYKYLRQSGVNARIDKVALRAGMELVQWMCNELEQADRVLLICDERYADRADGRHGGVGWETMLIQGDLYSSMYGPNSSNPTTGSKYIPIVLTEDLDRGRPAYVKTRVAVHWPDGADEQMLRLDLLRELFDVGFEEPPLGQRPDGL